MEMEFFESDDSVLLNALSSIEKLKSESDLESLNGEQQIVLLVWNLYYSAVRGELTGYFLSLDEISVQQTLFSLKRIKAGSIAETFNEALLLSPEIQCESDKGIDSLLGETTIQFISCLELLEMRLAESDAKICNLILEFISNNSESIYTKK
ncbi:hypothetical protein DLM76_20700 [Leptospira yasudae]|uniref:hypothetical protein n=1 Tax=Leptospira yasudae TaxID=2202201 RepID=UPI000E5A0C1C|nr:hypothetical protein [Leptospira yasudae]RHX90284.1 hypothetical protein DLM76_20700 [Leptospira yasudae]